MPNYGSCGWPEILEKLWAQTTINSITDCYEWNGHKAGEGYGVICWQGKQVYIHRLTFAQHHGYWPEVVRHSCDVPNCWNIGHLLGGSHADNVSDKVSKGRHLFGIKCHRAKLNDNKVREIKRLLETMSVVQLAVKYDVARSQIISIRDGKSWKHVAE